MNLSDAGLPVPCRDADIMAAIHQAAFGAEGWDAAFFARLVSLPPVFGFVAEHGLILAQAIAGEAEILTLGVAPESRRQGVARRLLDAAISESERRGAARMFLEVAADNIAARALYWRAGFAEAGRRRDYYGPGADAILLTRVLCAG
jgi:ribosomal-protein-alanine N-acetyltransferase